MADIKKDFLKPLLWEMIPDGLKLIPIVGATAVTTVGLTKKAIQIYEQFKQKKLSDEEAKKKAFDGLSAEEKAILNSPTVDMLKEIRMKQVNGEDELLPYIYRLVLICARGKRINSELADKINDIILSTENPAITSIIEESSSIPDDDDEIGARDFASRIRFSEDFVFFEIISDDDDYTRPEYNEKSCISFMNAINTELGDKLFDEFVPYTLDDLDESEYDEDEDCDE